MDPERTVAYSQATCREFPKRGHLREGLRTNGDLGGVEPYLGLSVDWRLASRRAAASLKWTAAVTH